MRIGYDHTLGQFTDPLSSPVMPTRVAFGVSAAAGKGPKSAGSNSGGDTSVGYGKVSLYTGPSNDHGWGIRDGNNAVSFGGQSNSFWETPVATYTHWSSPTAGGHLQSWTSTTVEMPIKPVLAAAGLALAVAGSLASGVPVPAPAW